jgi:hypothetical protein
VQARRESQNNDLTLIAVMPNRAIEFHDAVLAGVSFSRGEAQLHLSSDCVHQSEGVPGRDPGGSWVQQAILRLRHARAEGAFSVLPVDLSDGQIQMENKGFDNEIPVPLRHEGAFELRLQAAWQEQGVVSYKGAGAELELVGEPELCERVAHGGSSTLRR